MAVTMKCGAELLNCFPDFIVSSFFFFNILACVASGLFKLESDKQTSKPHSLKTSREPPSKELKVEWDILQGEKMRALAQAWV